MFYEANAIAVAWTRSEPPLLDIACRKSHSIWGWLARSAPICSLASFFLCTIHNSSKKTKTRIMKIVYQIHVIFGGNCSRAFNYYQSLFIDDDFRWDMTSGEMARSFSSGASLRLLSTGYFPSQASSLILGTFQHFLLALRLLWYGFVPSCWLGAGSKNLTPTV